jgi:hypothetical protein
LQGIENIILGFMDMFRNLLSGRNINQYAGHIQAMFLLRDHRLDLYPRDNGMGYPGNIIDCTMSFH